MPEAEDSPSHSFWKTLPRILTAPAAVIAGIIAILLQVGIVGCAIGSPASPAAANKTNVATPLTASTSAASVPKGKPWKDAEAIFTAKDGTVTRMPAETIRYCISVGTSINLNDSQDIAFEKISRIDVLRSDVAPTTDGTATLRVTLVSGSILEGIITSNCDFFGETEAGRYSLYPDKLLKIEFLR